MYKEQRQERHKECRKEQRERVEEAKKRWRNQLPREEDQAKDTSEQETRHLLEPLGDEIEGLAEKLTLDDQPVEGNANDVKREEKQDNSGVMDVKAMSSAYEGGSRKLEMQTDRLFYQSRMPFLELDRRMR